MSLKNSKILCIALIVLAGAWVRAADMEMHFPHADDAGVAKSILDAKRGNLPAPAFAVPRMWTYAPFQYLITHFLVRPGQSYREILFWGRLPSLIFSLAGLGAMVLLYREYEEEDSWSAVSALALLAFSWENIIFAKQMHNYALGTTACVLLLFCLFHNLNRPDYGFRRMALNGALMGALAWMHYQIFCFIFIFYALLFIRSRTLEKPLRETAGPFAVSAAVCVFFLVPLHSLFLKHALEQGIAVWKRGGHDEYVFVPPAGPLTGKLLYAADFFTRNFVQVFSADTGFFSEDHPLFKAVSGTLLFLFCAGLYHYTETADTRKRYLGLLWLFLAPLWIYFIVRQRFSWSPTRHNAILTPLFCLTVSDGIEYLAALLRARLKPGAAFSKWGHGAAAGVMAVFFFLSVPRAFAERKDPYNEEEIAGALRKYGVEALFTVDWATPVDLMPSVVRYFNGYYAVGFIRNELYTLSPPEYRTIAWISDRIDLTPESFEWAEKDLYIYNQLRGRNVTPVTLPLSAFRVVHSKVLKSRVQAEFSKKTYHGSNSFYFYVLEKI